MQYVLEHFSSFREPQPGGIRPKLETAKFEAAGLTWHLNIYPLGNNKAVSGRVRNPATPLDSPLVTAVYIPCAGDSFEASSQNTLAVFLAPDATAGEEARDLVKEDRFEGWCRNTHMEFTVINHRDPAHNVVKGEARLTVVTAVAEHCWLTNLASGVLVRIGAQGGLEHRQTA